MIAAEKPIGALCTQKDVDSENYERLQKFLGEKPRYHRKQWEFVYILRVLEYFGMLKENIKGIGFGCGTERIVPILANFGIKVLATDLDADKSTSWYKTTQHSSCLESWYNLLKQCPTLCDLNTFHSNTTFESADMNDIDTKFLNESFDFTWSACSLEHLGSLKHGMDFVLNSLDCLRPGGIAVHTTEYNVSSNEKTVDSKHTSIYRRRDIEELLSKCLDLGHEVSPMNFDSGALTHDNYVDIPPYADNAPHLKLKIQEYDCTSVGFYIIKK